MKRCGACLRYKTLTEFHRRNRSLDGRYGVCKQCRRYIKPTRATIAVKAK